MTTENLKPQFDDEIDLVAVAETIWNGKWTICAITFLFALLAVTYYLLTPSIFVAKSEIKPITSVEAERYRPSNAFGYYEIEAGRLQALYVEQLETAQLFADAMDQAGILDDKEFNTEAEYEQAIVELASLVEVRPPINADGSEKGESRKYWSIVFEHDDELEWKEILTLVHSEATENVRSTLQRRFELSLEVAKRKHAFELEDININISNALDDYDRKVSDRIAFLEEQAAIARKLGVDKSTIEAQTFASQSGVVANVQTDTPFYLRGYEAIEKEIELLNSRENKEAFVSGLVELEQQQRTIEQSKTLERAENLFSLTPVQTGDGFTAVTMLVHASEFEYSNTKKLIVVMAVFAGGMFGMFYVLISTAIRKRKSQPA